MQAAPRTPSLAMLASMSSNDSKMESVLLCLSVSCPLLQLHLAPWLLQVHHLVLVLQQPPHNTLRTWVEVTLATQSLESVLHCPSVEAWIVAEGGGDTGLATARTLLTCD